MNSLINAFNCKLYKFRDTHAVGSLQVFEQPCIGYINSGKAQFLYKGKSYYANKGDLIYIAKGTKYLFGLDRKSGDRVLFCKAFIYKPLQLL